MEYSANIDKVAPQLFEVVGVISIKNNCCRNKKIIITKTRGIDVFSCQCECGGWCTTGASAIEGAISEWKKISL